MKTRIPFHPIGEKSFTNVYDSESLTQPEMSLSIKEIVQRFAYLGETPVGMLSFAPPEIKDDERLFDSVDVERLDIAELEELAYTLNSRADYLRSLPPSPSPGAATMPNGEADAPIEEPSERQRSPAALNFAEHVLRCGREIPDERHHTPPPPRGLQMEFLKITGFDI